MRASKEVGGRQQKKKGACPDLAEMHISGAEGLFTSAEIEKAVASYIDRARNHSRGEPDRIVVTVEKIGERPRSAGTLPVTTLTCGSPVRADRLVRTLLESSGVSGRAIKEGLKILRGESSMRGAAVLSCLSGRRVDPDRRRGVRVSRQGIRAAAGEAIMSALAGDGMDGLRVMEALALASKVALCKEVKAELCISDNPDYRTGYFSSRQYGYVRIPNIKRKGAENGGRVFFLEEDAPPEPVISFLEKKPVMITSFAGYRGVCSIDELLGDHHR